MNVRAVCEGGFTLPLPLEEALPLFTPEGERLWAGASWEPVYAVPAAAEDDSSPGTVFTTEAHGGRAVWIVLERRSDGLRYARVSPDRIAGTVDVACAPDGNHGTRITVVYDVTSLGPDGAAYVEHFRAGYADFMESWRREILDRLGVS